MSVVQRLSGCLGPLLRLSSRQLATSQQVAAFHLSTTLEARRRSPASSSDSDDEQNPSSRGSDAPRGGAGVVNGPNAAASGNQQGATAASWDELSEAISEQVASQASAFDVQTLVSPALAAALAAAPEDDEGAAKAFEEFLSVTERWEQGKLKGDRPATEEDLRLLTEAIDLYLQSGPEDDPNEDVLEGFDQELLEALGEAVKEIMGDGTRSTVINTAPPGRLPWEVLDVNEEVPMINWGVDLTEGKAADPWKNALLSEEVKLKMYRLHKDGWDVPRLAQHFRVRQQRVMAILALKEREEAAAAEGRELNAELAEGMDDLQEAWEALGSGEKHHVTLPSFPNYKELTEADAERLAALLEARVGKPFDDITPEDMSEGVVQELMAAAGVDKAALEEELAAEEERHMVAEFRRALEYNVGKTGTSLSRSSRKKHPPARPEGGWSLLVQPLGKAAREEGREPYVALPDGSKRELTADERLHLERQQPRPHRKFL